MAATATRSEDDIFAPTAIANPQGYFRRLREIDPVYRSQRHGVWILTGHREVSEAFRDKRLSSATAIANFRRKLESRHADVLHHAMQLLDGWMLLRDEPHHARLRDPVRRAFTPAVAAGLATRIGARVDALLDELSERADIVADFAQPLTAGVICDLLGVAGEEADFLRGWTRDFGKLIYGASSHGEDYASAVGRAGDLFHDRMAPLIEQRRSDPRDDLISHLIRYSEAEHWTMAELLGAASMLLFAGHDTTSALIASATRALLVEREALACFRAEPALAETAIEELLRYDGPSKTFVRTASEDHERGGHAIRAGDQLWLSVMGANHDPEVFEAPTELRLDRDPNPHVSFGGGPHFCLGAALARVEAREALGRLFQRFPRLGLAPVEPCWSPTLVDRSLLALPVMLGA